MQIKDLKKVYDTVIRPGTEYCSVVYHSLIPQYLSDRLESVQKMATKIIYGHGANYATLVENGTVELLSDRRESAILEFGRRNEGSERFKRWFPLATVGERDVRRGTHRKYQEAQCKTERMRSNPVQYMIRKLNSEQ